MPDMAGRGEWRGDPWVGKWNHWEIAGYYQGVAALLLAIPGAVLGLLLRGRSAAGDGPTQANPRLALELPILLLLSIAALSIALGDAGALHPLLFRHFPLYAALRCPSRALSILVLTVPILAALVPIGCSVGFGPSAGGCRSWDCWWLWRFLPSECTSANSSSAWPRKKH
jgi:hypothetical protein